MGIRFSLAAVVALVLAVFLGVKVAGLTHFFGVAVPYAAIFIFLGGVVYRVLVWGRSPFLSGFPRRPDSRNHCLG